jgi:hypothetical protein
MTLLRPTYANVTATLALVVALSGTAYAAGLPKHSVGTKQLKKNAVTSAVLKDGAVSSPDIADQGIEPGDLSAASRALAAAGPASPTLVSGGVHDLVVPSTAGPRIHFGPVSGQAVATNDVTDVAELSPSRAVTISNLQVRITAGLSTVDALRVDVVASPSPADDAGAVTVASCTIAGPSVRTCTSNGTATVPGGSFVYARVVTSTSQSGGELGAVQLAAYSMSLTPVG